MADYDVTLWTGLNVNAGDYYLADLAGLGSAGLREQAADLPGEDGVRFGREFTGSKSLTLEGTMDGADVWAAQAAFQAAWDDPSVRSVAGAVVPLKVQRPGRAAVLVYGRPDRYDPELEDADTGHIAYTATFRQSDPKHYADTETAVVLQTSTASETGLVLVSGGLDAPLTTTAPTQRAGFITNNGDAHTWPVVTFYGAVTNPEVTLYDETGALVWQIALSASLAHDQSAVIDTRPWARTALRNDGANLSGSLSRESWLSQSQLPPGRHEVVFSASGSASCEFRFRDAYLSI